MFKYKTVASQKFCFPMGPDNWKTEQNGGHLVLDQWKTSVQYSRPHCSKSSFK